MSSGLVAAHLRLELLNAEGQVLSDVPWAATLVDVGGCSVAFYSEGAWTRSPTTLSPAGAFGNPCLTDDLASQIEPGEELNVTSVTSLAGMGNYLEFTWSTSNPATTTVSIP